jgi:hypothetical protein
VLRKKFRPVLGLRMLVTRTCGSFSIGLPYANSNRLGNFELILLPRPRPQFCLVL